MANIDPIRATYRSYTGPVGSLHREQLHFSEAVRIPLPGGGALVKVSGQTGRDIHLSNMPSDLKTQIGNACDNVLAAMTTVDKRLTWQDVYHVKSYHVADVNISGQVDREGVGLMTAALKRWCGPHHRPTFTCIGVPWLAEEPMKVEIEVEAYLAPTAGT